MRILAPSLPTNPTESEPSGGVGGGDRNLCFHGFSGDSDAHLSLRTTHRRTMRNAVCWLTDRTGACDQVQLKPEAPAPSLCGPTPGLPQGSSDGIGVQTPGQCQQVCPPPRPADSAWELEQSWRSTIEPSPGTRWLPILLFNLEDQWFPSRSSKNGWQAAAVGWGTRAGHGDRRLGGSGAAC